MQLMLSRSQFYKQNGLQVAESKLRLFCKNTLVP